MERGTAAPTFRPMSVAARGSPLSATAELSSCFVVDVTALCSAQCFDTVGLVTGMACDLQNLASPDVLLWGPNLTQSNSRNEGELNKTV